MEENHSFISIRTIYDFFKKLSSDSVSFMYHGFISDEFTDKIIGLSEKNIEKINDSKTVKNRVSFLIAESFQNVVRHSDSIENESQRLNRPSVFLYRIIGDTYLISSVNLINNNNTEDLRSKIKQINSLDKDQLKTLSLEIKSQGCFSEKGGAGLGLIEMARKTGNKLEYDIEKINDQYSYFYLQMRFDSKATDENIIDDKSISLTKQFYDLINENNTYLAYKGDFTQENILILLKIIERNLQINQFEHESLKSLIYVVLSELLQNVSKHAYMQNNRKEGIFLIGRYFNKYILSTENFIENSKIVAFKDNFEHLRNLSKEDLKQVYLNKVANNEIDDEGNAGIGFIEIAKECEEINYIITPVNEKISFLTLYVKF